MERERRDGMRGNSSTPWKGKEKERGGGGGREIGVEGRDEGGGIKRWIYREEGGGINQRLIQL